MNRVSDEKSTLTERQQQALDFIARYIDGHGYPPTLREIGVHMGIRSTNGVNDHLKALEKKGYLEREDLKSRALRPLMGGASARERQRPMLSAIDGGRVDPPIAGSPAISGDIVELPLLGRVAAGQPILAVENAEGTLKVDRFFLGAQPRGGDREMFALRVVGESMIDAGILDGDFIFVRKQSEAQRGEVVVAMIEGEATVKYYFPEGERVVFKPANRQMSPIVVSRRDFRAVDVLGVVVGVYRKL